MTNEVGGLQIEDLDLDDDGSILTVRLHVRNDGAAPLFAYATARNVKYDPQTRTLALVLGDRGVAAAPAPTHFLLPRIVTVEPGRQGEIEVKVPRVLATARAASQGPAPRIERLPAHAAAVVAVEVAWSDQPFDAARPPAPAAWTRGYATYRKVLG